MQITLPQFRQFGAAERRGWRAATQLHLRAAIPAAELVEWEGFVVISSERMAWSRSESAVEAPCMGTPPAMDILVALPPLWWFLPDGPGVEVLEFGFDLALDLGRPRSDTRVPVAEGGALEDCVGGGVAVLTGGALLGPALAALDGVDVPDLLATR